MSPSHTQSGETLVQCPECQVASFEQGSVPSAPEDNEAIHARGVVLSVLQAVVLVIGLALLFVAVAGNVFAGILVVGAALAILGSLHYWLWGRWMSPAVPQPSRKEPR